MRPLSTVLCKQQTCYNVEDKKSVWSWCSRMQVFRKREKSCFLTTVVSYTSLKMERFKCLWNITYELKGYSHLIRPKPLSCVCSNHRKRSGGHAFASLSIHLYGRSKYKHTWTYWVFSHYFVGRGKHLIFFRRVLVLNQLCFFFFNILLFMQNKQNWFALTHSESHNFL